jgi:rhomboid protease GluP
MTESIPDIREFILRQCAAAAPNPWFPAVFARDNTIPRDHLDRHVDELRMAGLIRIADWVQGKGQGYALTPEGADVLENPRDLARLRSGKLKLNPEPQIVPADPTSWQGTVLDRGNRVRQAVLAPPQPVVTRALILINVMVFALGMALAIQEKVPLSDFLFSNDNPDVREIDKKIGALSGSMVWKGEWFRLLTCCFVHFGLLHLGVNMYSLFAVGSIQEGMWGRLGYLGLYLIAGLGGSCAVVIFKPGDFVAGASGAIFGLMGSLAVWIFLNRRHLGPAASAWLRRLMVVFALNIFISALPGISAAAHFGGLAVGMIAAVLLNVFRYGAGPQRWLALLGFLALPGLSLAAVYSARAKDPRWQAALWGQSVTQARGLFQDAMQIARGPNIESLIKTQGATPDAETARKIAAQLGEGRGKLAAAKNALQGDGVFSIPAIEAERRDYIVQVDEASQRLAALEFEGGFLPLAQQSQKDAVLAYQQVKGLASLPAGSAKHEADALKAALARLKEVASLLEKAGPYATGSVAERQRQTLAQLLADKTRLFELQAKQLQQDLTRNVQEAQEAEELERRVEELSKQWLQLKQG